MFSQKMGILSHGRQNLFVGAAVFRDMSPVKLSGAQSGRTAPEQHLLPLRSLSLGSLDMTRTHLPVEEPGPGPHQAWFPSKIRTCRPRRSSILHMEKLQNISASAQCRTMTFLNPPLGPLQDVPFLPCPVVGRPWGNGSPLLDLGPHL